MKLARAKSARALGTLGLAAFAVLASPLAAAIDQGWYGGFNIGQSRSDFNNEKITDDVLGSGFSTSSIRDDNRDIGYKVFGGYQFNRYLAFEGGYFNLGKFDYKATTVPAGTLSGDLETKGLNLDAVGLLPITERLSALGRIGVIYTKTDDSFSGTGSVSVLDAHRNDRDTSFKAGLGLQYAVTESFGVRAEAERYRVDDGVGHQDNVDLLSVGLVYRFGGETAPPERVVVAPPAPRPVAVTPPPPPPPVLQKVTFSADSLFDFDKAIVKPGGMQALDQFAAKLKGVDFDVITVTGHTDRIGSHEYNMELSTRRAEAVKNYLVESAGIPSAKIAARGTDGTDPVTKPGECEGTKVTQALIDCLQPDRRVEVEVTGTR